MKADIDSLAVLIRKMEKELDSITNLLKNKDTILKDSDLVFLLIYRKIIEKLDAVFILCDNGHESSSESITRDAFENYLHLAYINKENYEYRTTAYLYENLQNQLKIINWFNLNNKQGKQLKAFLRTDKLGFPSILSERRNYINDRLTSERFNNIHIDWKRKLSEKRKGKKGSSYPTWFNIGNGAKNVADLSRVVGMKEEYKTVYSLFSLQVHSLNALNQLKKAGDNLGELIPIRNDDKEGLSIQVAITLGVQSLRIVIEKFHKEGRDLFLKWYVKDFKKEVAKEKTK